MDLKRELKTTNVITTYGQVVLGPPGSGKTTYCARIAQFYRDRLNRRVEIVNLDPANDNMNYTPRIDISALVSVQEVMEDMHLGPNGALLYCMEYLEANIDWLLEQLAGIKDVYLVFDMPGQVELYTHHSSIKTVFNRLQSLNYNLCAIHVVDSHYCSDPAKFISTLLLSLSTMLQIGLPHVNVLSKIDVMKKNVDKLDFGLDFYTDVLQLDYLLELLDESPFSKKFKKLNKALVSLVQDYGLVCFIPLDVTSDRSILTLKSAVDKANGYVYGSGEERTIQTLLSCAVGARTETERFDSDYF